MKNKIKAIQGVYPITVFDAVKKVDPTILREKDLKSIKSVPR